MMTDDALRPMTATGITIYLLILINSDTMTENERNERLNALASIVLDKEAYLLSTDYISAKLAEGVATKEEYAEKLALRNEARKAINDAQKEMAELEAMEVEDEMMIFEGDGLD